MKKTKVYFYLLIFIGLGACDAAQKEGNNSGTTKVSNDKDAKELVRKIETNHGKEVFASHDAIQFDMDLVFKGNRKFSGRVYLTTDGQLIQAKEKNKTLYWNGQKGMVLPDTASNTKVGNQLLTWAYFFSAPYKLSDLGTNHQSLGKKTLAGNQYEANKLTFDKNTGSSPDDWYIVYKGDEDLLVAMAYIATKGKKSKKEAEKNPHAITYEAFVEVDGIPFATIWNFWTWDEQGNLEKHLGTASIGDIRFMKKAGDTFYPAASFDDDKEDALN